MPDERKLVQAHMRSLIKGYGCLDAAAETINAHWDCETSKGTLSKKLSGQFDWTISDIIALEDGLDQHPVTRLLARRLEPSEGEGVECLNEQSGVIAKECGEAVAAILSAQRSANSQDETNAVKEIDEALVSLMDARDTLAKKRNRYPATNRGG